MTRLGQEEKCSLRRFPYCRTSVSNLIESGPNASSLDLARSEVGLLNSEYLETLSGVMYAAWPNNDQYSIVCPVNDVHRGIASLQNSRFCLLAERGFLAKQARRYQDVVAYHLLSGFSWIYCASSGPFESEKALLALLA